eukprot:15289153-Ditylum_brightwellii.AAC.1
MLKACVYPVMKTYWLKGGTVGYKGDVFNIKQDIGGLVLSLLQSINQLLIIIVQKLHISMRVDTKTSEFDAMQYNSGLPFYKRTTLYTLLLEDNSVKEQANTVEEEELGQDAENILTAARETNVSSIQASLEREQREASGANNPDEDQINEGYIAAPLISNSQTENKQLCQIFSDRFSHNSSTSSQNMNFLLAWP